MVPAVLHTVVTDTILWLVQLPSHPHSLKSPPRTHTHKHPEQISFWFIVSLFFTPLLASIPPYATGPALVLVGAMMVINIVKIDWANIQEAVPAFLTFIVMPLTYSIAYGVIAGIMSWIIINGSVAAWNYVSLKIWGRPDHVEEGSSWKMVRQVGVEWEGEGFWGEYGGWKLWQAGH